MGVTTRDPLESYYYLMTYHLSWWVFKNPFKQNMRKSTGIIFPFSDRGKTPTKSLQHLFEKNVARFLSFDFGDLGNLTQTLGNNAKLQIQVSHEKNPPTFHCTGWLIEILIVAYYNPHKTG